MAEQVLIIFKRLAPPLIIAGGFFLRVILSLQVSPTERASLPALTPFMVCQWPTRPVVTL